MLQQLALHTQQIIKATSTQDLDPLPLANNDHPSVLPFEMYAIEPGEPPSRTLNWKPMGFLRHIKCRTNTIGSLFHFGRSGFVLLSVCQYRHLLDPLSSVLVTFSTTTRSEIIRRHAKSSPRLHRCTIGWCTVWVAF